MTGFHFLLGSIIWKSLRKETVSVHIAATQQMCFELDCLLLNCRAERAVLGPLPSIVSTTQAQERKNKASKGSSCPLGRNRKSLLQEY